MSGNVLIGLSTMTLCLILQALLVSTAVLFYSRNHAFVRSTAFLSTLVVLTIVMLVLVIGNFLQIIIWASLFVQLGEFESYSTAAYHSAVNFSTLGYGDIVMSEQHRVLGPIQAINGVLMIGVSTAVVMAALQDALKYATQNFDNHESKKG